MQDSLLKPGGLECSVCRAKVAELRRGRCWGCYGAWVEGRPVGLGARCATCHEKRRRFLRMVELFGAWRPMCFNCEGQLSQLDPVPLTLEGLKIAVSRERRRRDRRYGKPDSRVFRYERRVGDRRTGRDADPMVDDDMIIEITVDDSIPSEPDDHDITAIRDLVAELRPGGSLGA